MSSLLEKQINFPPLKNIVLIGGGDLMAISAKIFKGLNFNLNIIAAPRHISESLTLSNETLSDICEQLSIKPNIIPDINQMSKNELSEIIPTQAIAICFGPAWIFNGNVLSQFSYGMFNINAIPIPNYLGGAHYTWQLLNKNFKGGCFFQQITNKLDQGDIFDKHHFNISQNACSPSAYFSENIEQGSHFIRSLASKFIEGATFTPISYTTLNNHRLYFPRLRTDKQAYINWQWSAQEIVSFCQGFDKPYAGAASFIKKTKLRFKKVTLTVLTDENNEEILPMHPFCSGLIIRKITGTIIVAARNGFIALKEVYDEQEQCFCSHLKEGMRIHTPQSTLDKAMSYEVKIDAQGFKD